MEDAFDRGKLDTLPTAEEIWRMAGALAQTYKIVNEKKYWRDSDGVYHSLQELAEQNGEDIQDWNSACRNLARFAKGFGKLLEEAAGNSIEEGETYKIQGMKPKYLNGVNVQVVSTDQGFAYSRILDETGNKMSQGYMIGVPFQCLTAA